MYAFYALSIPYLRKGSEVAGAVLPLRVDQTGGDESKRWLFVFIQDLMSRRGLSQAGKIQWHVIGTLVLVWVTVALA